jgi:hypothetical protein
MIGVGVTRTRSALALICLVSSLGAAGTIEAQKGKTCDIGSDNSSESLAGRLFLSRATDPKAPPEQRDSLLRQAVGVLGGKFDYAKEAGRSYLLSEALALIASDPKAPTVGPRSSFGFKDNPTGQVDILATADTLINAFVAKRPECAPDGNNIRLQAYAPITNASMAAINAGNYALADTLSRRAVVIYKQSPYVYTVMGGVAIHNNDYPAALGYYQQVVTLSGTDSTYRRLKNQGMYNIAVVTEQMAEAATGPEKKAKSDSAIALWRAYVAANPTDVNGQAGLTHALQASGDTAAAGQLYSDMLNNPSKYTDIQLFQAAQAARVAQQDPIAYKLTSLGLAKNPYYRDGLLFTVSEDFNAGRSDSLLPRVWRLVTIDPNNPDNWQIMVGAYQLKIKADCGESATSRPKSAAPPPCKDAAARKIDQDSLLAIYPKYKDPKVRVTITKLAVIGDSLAVAGRVENLTDAAATYTLKFSFINPQGAVVATKDAAPVTVPAKGTGTYDVATHAPGAVAYKYAPLD